MSDGRRIGNEMGKNLVEIANKMYDEPTKMNFLYGIYFTIQEEVGKKNDQR